MMSVAAIQPHASIYCAALKIDFGEHAVKQLSKLLSIPRKAPKTPDFRPAPVAGLKPEG
jgi:hypothetical protein